jgi:hypothetical protein
MSFMWHYGCISFSDPLFLPILWFWKNQIYSAISIMYCKQLAACYHKISQVKWWKFFNEHVVYGNTRIATTAWQTVLGTFLVERNFLKPIFSYFNIMLVMQLPPTPPPPSHTHTNTYACTQKSKSRIICEAKKCLYLNTWYFKVYYHPTEHITLNGIIILFKG